MEAAIPWAFDLRVEFATSVSTTSDGAVEFAR
jgi:hypothetical protein